VLLRRFYIVKKYGNVETSGGVILCPHHHPFARHLDLSGGVGFYWQTQFYVQFRERRDVFAYMAISAKAADVPGSAHKVVTVRHHVYGHTVVQPGMKTPVAIINVGHYFRPSPEAGAVFAFFQHFLSQ
jgi:hypothetical protein